MSRIMPMMLNEDDLPAPTQAGVGSLVKKDGCGSFEKVMHEWKKGELHSGKSKKPVESQEQALAIAFAKERGE